MSQPKKKEKKSYFNKYNQRMSDKSQILNCIKNDIRSNQTEDDAVTNLSLFCEKKDDFLALISGESKFNFTYIYYDCIYIIILLMIYYIYIYFQN